MSDQRILIKNGRLIDGRGRDGEADLLIDNGRIAEVGLGLEAADALEIDATGHWVLPGLCDIHVHFREPGYEYKETIATGAQAALMGGFTDVACMPNTDPPIDDLPTVRLVVERARAAALARVHPIAAVTVGQKGESLTEMAELHAAGAVAFSDDGLPVRSAEIMRRALEYARMIGVPIIDHCEDPDLARGGVMHEGTVSTQLGLRGIPAAAEEVMVARDLRLAAMTGAHVHLAHMSTEGSVQLIREAKANGIRVTAEVTPHHLSLTDETVRSYDPVTKVNPPLRTERDVNALRAALVDGTIDAIATDHAPHSSNEKECEYDAAPFGLIGLETAVGVVMTELVTTKLMTPARLVETMSHAPRRIIGFDEIVLEPGAPADLTVIDPREVWHVDLAQLASRSRNCPFRGREMIGRVRQTFVDGRRAYEASDVAAVTT